MQKMCSALYAKIYQDCGMHGMGVTVHPATKAEGQLTFGSN